jgi:beta-glucosidase
MPFAMIFNRDLKALVERGEVPVERIDDAALRLLRQQIRFAQGRDPQAYSTSVVGSEAHRQIARQAAEKSIVLLKNEGGLLPLRDVKRLVVIGKLADTPNTGDSGSSNTRPAYVVTPLQGLRKALGERVTVDYDDGSDLDHAIEVAKGADVVVLVVGYTHLDEGEYISPDMIAPFVAGFPPPSPEEMPIAKAMMEASSMQDINASPPGGDRKLLTLHPDDEALIQSVAAVNDRTVVAIMAGSAVITEAWRAQVPGILMLWYPGMEGGHAFADLLLGWVNPSGKLPCVFPKRAEDLPHYEINASTITYNLWHGYRKLERDGVEPAFPFGYGLSYTTFQYGNLHLEKPRLGQQDILVAVLEVTNTGGVAGEEIVQFYVATHGSRVERAPKELKAFTRVALQPGETQTVRVEIPVKELAYYDEQQGWTVEPLVYELIAARHSLDEKAQRVSFAVE